MTKCLGGLCGLASLLLVLGSAVGGATGAGDDGTKKNKVNFDEVFAKLDANMDGKLNKEEFLKIADRAKAKEKAREKLGQAYDKIDPQNKGIGKEQFKKYLELRKKS